MTGGVAALTRFEILTPRPIFVATENPAGEDERMKDIDQKTQTELEAAAFRTLVEHLRNRTDVQNIDMMNLAGFCRNCLSRWYGEAAEAQGIELSKEDAREIVYGMPYAEWKDKYQTEASADQQAKFSEEIKKVH